MADVPIDIADLAPGSIVGAARNAESRKHAIEHEALDAELHGSAHDSPVPVPDAGPDTVAAPPPPPASSPVHLAARLVINLFLPFVNGMMLGFGEILAHELGFKWRWAGARVYRPVALAPPARKPVYEK